MPQNYMWNLVLIFTVVFELARLQTFCNAYIINRLTDYQTFWQNNYYLEKYNFFDVHLLDLFCRQKFHGLTQFFNQISFTRFWDILKKRTKKKNTTFFMHDYNTWPYPIVRSASKSHLCAKFQFSSLNRFQTKNSQII